MLQMNTLGDGNCLYNSEAIWLILAYQQKSLSALLKKNTLHFANLMLILGQQNPTLGLPKALDQLNTIQALEKAFDSFIAHITINERLDFVRLQKLLAKALRSFVVDVIKNDPIIKAAAIADLSAYIDGICESSDEINSTKDEICALRIELSNHLEVFHLQPQPQAPKKLPLLKAFVANEFEQFIDNKIAESKEKKAKITDFVKSELKKVVKQSIQGSKKRALKTLSEDVQAALMAHLGAVIADDIEDGPVSNFSAHFEGMKDIQNAMKAILDKPDMSLEQKKQAIKQWFFENQAIGLKLYLNDKDGIAKNGVHAGEFEQKVMSQAFGHIIKVRCLDYLDDHNTRIVNGFKTGAQAKKYPKNSLVFDMEKLPGHWSALLPKTAANEKLLADNAAQRLKYAQEKRKKESQAHQDDILKEFGSYAKHHKSVFPEDSLSVYCSLMSISESEYHAVSSNLNEAPKADTQRHIDVQDSSQRDWTNYAMLMVSITGFVAIISSGVIWPLIAPLLAKLFAQTLTNTGLFTLTKFGAITLFSGLVGYVVTEKLHLDSEEMNQALPQGTMQRPLEESYFPRSILSLFNSTKAQDEIDKTQGKKVDSKSDLQTAAPSKLAQNSP